MKLYQIDAEIELLLSSTIEDGGELSEEQITALERLEGERDKKALDIACLVKQMEAEAEAVSIVESAMITRRRALENNANRLRDYLADHLPVGTKLKDSRATIGWRRSEKLLVTDQAAIPTEFKRFKVEEDKNEIKKAIKAGRDVPGAAIVENQNLQIG